MYLKHFKTINVQHSHHFPFWPGLCLRVENTNITYTYIATTGSFTSEVFRIFAYPNIHWNFRGVGASWEEGGRVKKGTCVACEELEGLSPPSPTPLNLLCTNINFALLHLSEIWTPSDPTCLNTVLQQASWTVENHNWFTTYESDYLSTSACPSSLFNTVNQLQFSTVQLACCSNLL